MQEARRATVVERARGAAVNGDWRHAYELLIEADTDTPLAPADLPFLAAVAYAAGHLDVTIEAWERAHAASLRAGDRVAAAGAAVRVGMHLLFDTALLAPVRGWLARAEARSEDARSHFRAAADGFARWGQPLDAARCTSLAGD